MKTDTYIQPKKPHTVVYDKVKNEIIIAEVEITSQHQLQTTEVEKMRKYEMLAKQLGMIYKCETTSFFMFSLGMVQCDKLPQKVSKATWSG
jgi:hypothetical protein